MPPASAITYKIYLNFEEGGCGGGGATLFPTYTTEKYRVYIKVYVDLVLIFLIM